MTERGSPDNQLRAIIESLADGIVIVDQSGLIRFANPAAASLFNRTPAQLVGTLLGTPLVAGESAEMEIVRRGGGSPVNAELRVVEAEWEGEIVELVSLRDITDRRANEERTRQLAHEREARLQAEAASRTKSDFLAIMSHELRTPLNAILGYSELIELGISGTVSETVRDQVARIRASARHLLGLVNDILDLAKVDAGRLVVANAPAVVLDAITSALSLLQPQASARRLAVVIAPGAETLPPYIGDSERVRQIIVNLLSNAVKCTDAGGTITIEASLQDNVGGERPQPRDAYVRVSVRDTGSGIPADKLSAIFEPFVQADSGPTRPREGSGLGLTIGRRLARAMGGDITVESTPGEGSTFHLWLPTDTSAAAAAEPAPTKPPHNTGAPNVPTGSEGLENLRGLTQVANGILSELGTLMTVIVERIRCDLPIAAGLRTAQVADHLSTLLADMAGALVVVEEVGGRSSPLLADAMEIQRLISERHGAQRALLGWTEASVRREFMIIREELERVLQRHVPHPGTLSVATALGALNRFVDQAEYISVRTAEMAQTTAST